MYGDKRTIQEELGGFACIQAIYSIVNLCSVTFTVCWGTEGGRMYVSLFLGNIQLNKSSCTMKR